MPILALQNIFRFLDLADRQRLRRVSKKWKFVLETMRPQRDLCIYSHSYPFEEKWTFSNEKIACEDMLYYCDPCDSSSSHKLMPFMEELERLYLYWTGESSRFFLRNLPLLNKLKVLIVRYQYSHQFCFFSENDTLEQLSSKSLEKLSITFTEPTDTQLDLDTPNLQSLVVSRRRVHLSLNSINYRFRYPLSIRYLQCIVFNSMLSVCKNVQELVCKQISFPFDLNKYRSLRKVNIYPLLDDRYDTLNRLTEQRDRLHRENLQILVFGFDCTHLYHCNIDSQMLLDKDNLEILAANRSKLIEPIPWRCFFDFEPLYEVFGRIRKDLPKIFSKIRTIEIGLLEPMLEVSDVVNFLAETNVTELILEKCNFKKEFYEQLPTVKSIKKLNITERSLDSQDYSYMAKLEHLNSATIGSLKLSKEFVHKFVNSKFFNFLNFQHSSSEMWFYLSINKLKGKRYHLMSNSTVYRDPRGETKKNIEFYVEDSDQIKEDLLRLEYDHDITFLIS